MPPPGALAPTACDFVTHSSKLALSWDPQVRHNQIDGQRNLRDAVRRTISFSDPKSGKSYELKSKVNTCLR
jgi:hypothetical protein